MGKALRALIRMAPRSPPTRPGSRDSPIVLSSGSDSDSPRRSVLQPRRQIRRHFNSSTSSSTPTATGKVHSTLDTWITRTMPEKGKLVRIVPSGDDAMVPAPEEHAKGALFRIVPTGSAVMPHGGAAVVTPATHGLVRRCVIPNMLDGASRSEVRSFSTTAAVSFRSEGSTVPELPAAPTASASDTVGLEPREMGENEEGSQTSESSLELPPVKETASVRTETPQPKRSDTGARIITYDASLATAAPITTPHALTSPLPFFSYHESNPPSIAYTTSASEADDLIACLRGNVLGLDLEWPPPGAGPIRLRTARDGTVVPYRDGVWDPATRKPSWPQGRTSLIQVTDGRMVVLFHVKDGTQPGPGLVRLLADPGILKTGVAIRNDALKLVRDFPACASSPPAGLLELSRIARTIEPERWRSAGGLVALARLCQGYLGRDLDKGDVRLGAWDLELDQEQIDYAVNDVMVSFLLYGAMMRRATELGMSFDAREMAVTVPGRLVPGAAGAAGAVVPPLAPAVSVLKKPDGVADEHWAAYTHFLTRDVPDLAASMGIKETVVQSYIFNSAQSLPLSAISTPDRRRMLDCVSRGTWVATKYGIFLGKVRKSLESESENSDGSGSALEAEPVAASDAAVDVLVEKLKGLDPGHAGRSSPLEASAQEQMDEMMRVLGHK